MSKDKEPVSKEDLLVALKMLQTQDYVVLYGENKNKPHFKYHRGDTE